MSQTQTNKPAGAIGAQAAAAATTTTNGKPADAKPADAAKSTDAKPDDKAAGEADKKNKNPNKIFIVVGQVHEFETPAKAEKFLNGDDAPTEYAVLRGKRVGSKKRVSLR